MGLPVNRKKKDKESIMQPFMKNAFVGLCIAAGFLFVSSTAQAQVLAHSGDVAGSVGYINSSGFGGHLSYGGSGGINLSERVALVGEYQYLSLGSVTPNVGISNSSTNQLGGVAVRVNFLTGKRIAPYVLGGFGFEHLGLKVTGSSTSIDNGYYDTFGGGASVFLGKNWGVRPEARYDYELGVSNALGTTVYAYQNVYQFSGSVFYQFGGRGKTKKPSTTQP
jgi:hypothetical protein